MCCTVTITLVELQANQTLLFCLGRRTIDSCLLSWENPLYRWSRGRVSGAAAMTLVVGLVPRVINKAVCSMLTVVLHSDGQFCGAQRAVDTIYVHAEKVGV